MQGSCRPHAASPMVLKKELEREARSADGRQGSHGAGIRGADAHEAGQRRGHAIDRHGGLHRFGTHVAPEKENGEIK